MVADIKRFRQQIGGKKVYIVGEFGFIPPAGIAKSSGHRDCQRRVGCDDLESAISQSRRRILLAFRTGQRESLQPVSLSGFSEWRGLE